MQLSDFNFELPDNLIASYPLEERSQSRLLCVHRQTGQTDHLQFSKIVELLTPNDLLIVNNTRVIPARAFGSKSTGGKVEILVERIITPQEALCHVRSSKSMKIGTEIFFSNNVVATVTDKKEELVQLKFSANVLDTLHEQGEMPLPHYFKRAPEESDKIRYQTVFAAKDGAVAAPTAGLHFDEKILTALKEKDIKIAHVTLHVGAGTFKPIRVEDFTTHKMHAEWMSIDAATCQLINDTKRKGGRVVAVGTTSVRTLESAMSFSNGPEIQPFEGNTDIFIYPGYQFNIVDAMITNFHLPKTSLLLLISAFANKDIILKAYQEAIEQQYRFFSYGDAMFIY